MEDNEEDDKKDDKVEEDEEEEEVFSSYCELVSEQFEVPSFAVYEIKQ